VLRLAHGGAAGAREIEVDHAVDAVHLAEELTQPGDVETAGVSADLPEESALVVGIEAEVVLPTFVGPDELVLDAILLLGLAPVDEVASAALDVEHPDVRRRRAGAGAPVLPA